MIKLASKKYPDQNFKVLDILKNPHETEKFDVVLSSGIFNRKINNHNTFVEGMIKTMFNLSKEAVGFNILSSKARFKEKDEYYANPEELLSYCKSLTTNVVMKHNYMEHDVTYFLYKI